MTSNRLRQEFLSFFKKKGHQIVPSSSLVPADPSVLFTTAGMQQFKPYYLGKRSPYGPDVVSCQKCFRTSDIDEVGDESHLTFLEMLGNFSFPRALAKGEEEDLSSSPGGYFKKEAIELAYEFLFGRLKLPLEGVVFTVFEGDKDVPEDKESIEIWKSLGIPEEKIKKCGREDNFWGPTGQEGPCGPTTEIHIIGIEVWNLVFNEYYCSKDKKLTKLKQKGVDTGMGLERLAMVVQKKPNVFETDLFEPIIKEIPKGDEKARRVIADHIKSAVFLISEEIFPSNVESGYALRRVLRRAIWYSRDLPKNLLITLAKKTVEIYKDIYPEVKSKEADILTVMQNEEEKYKKALAGGISETTAVIMKKGGIDGATAFGLSSTLGIPPEGIIEIAREKGVEVDISRFKKEFEEAFERHREISRAGAESKFGGVGKEATRESAKLHTATHLLHAALRKILGEHVKQMGSDITPQRLRFDFQHPSKMTEEQIKEVEGLVNQKIKEDLEVKREEMEYEEALKSGALAFFKEKYPKIVSVYSVTELPKEAKVKKRMKSSSPGDFSKEICAGPHIKRTSEIGQIKIVKEESSGAGVRRIRAIILK